MQLWEQWYETASNVWKRSMDGGKETVVDPFGLYRVWLKSAGEAQQQLLTGTTKMLGFQEAWQRWFETTTEPWRRAAENGADPIGLIAQWLEMMDETRATVSKDGSLPTDPIPFFKQWYDATSETLSKVSRDSIGTDAFMQSASQFMESYTSFTMTFVRASEEYFSYLLLPTRSDIARVAQLVSNLEEKVDKLDVAFEEAEDGRARSTTKTNAAINSVTDRLNGVEHNLETLPGVLQKLASAENLQKRLDSVEGKLETLLSALENLAAKETASAPRPANSKRKTQASGNGNPRRKANEVKDKA